MLPAPGQLVADAIDASASGKRRGCNSKDKRFRWRVYDRKDADGLECMIDLQDDSAWPVLGTDPRASAVPTSPRTLTLDDKNRVVRDVSARVCGAVFADDEMVLALMRTLERRLRGTRCQAAVTGSTAVRAALVDLGCDAERISRVCPRDSDLDADVVAGSKDVDLVRAKIDSACADILSSHRMSEKIVRRVEDAGIGWAASRSNSVLICRHPGRDGAVVAVDVPRFEDACPRLPFSCLSASRNDTMDRGVVLHRIRLSGEVTVAEQKVRVSVPIFDIKSYVGYERDVKRMSIETASSTDRIPVPTPRHLCIELSSMLTRKYDNVDASKDGKRLNQLRELERQTRSRDRAPSQPIPVKHRADGQLDTPRVHLAHHSSGGMGVPVRHGHKA